MPKDGTTSVVLGAPSEDWAYTTHFTESGSVHVDIAPRTTVVFYTAGELLNMGNALIEAARELDARQANAADAHHGKTPDPINTDYSPSPEVDAIITKGYSY